MAITTMAKYHRHSRRSQKPYVVEESDKDLEDNEEEPQPHGTVEEEEESEIVESDLKFEGETVEPDNDLPQKIGDPSVEVTEEITRNEDIISSYHNERH